MSPDSLYLHNPNCSKSRQALTLLHERGVHPTLLAYLDTPPDAAQLRWLLDRLGTGARGLLRAGEEVHGRLGLEDPTLDEATLIEAMVAHPVLIERPIFVHRGKAVVGRPPERVLELL